VSYGASIRVSGGPSTPSPGPCPGGQGRRRRHGGRTRAGANRLVTGAEFQESLPAPHSHEVKRCLTGCLAADQDDSDACGLWRHVTGGSIVLQAWYLTWCAKFAYLEVTAGLFRCSGYQAIRTGSWPGLCARPGAASAGCCITGTVLP